MDVWQWVCVVAVAWLVLACVVGLILGRIVRLSDAEATARRLKSTSSVKKLEGMLAAP